MTSSESNKEKDYTKSEGAKVQSLTEVIGNPRIEDEDLAAKAARSRRTYSGKIGFMLLAVGTLALLASFAKASQILAFIGLSLIFWASLLHFARPVKYVRSTVTESTSVSSYMTIDRIIRDLDYKGKPVYVPSYPGGQHIPAHLKGLQEMIVYIPAEEDTRDTIPTVEEMAERRFLLKNPRGICITPPGYGLLSLIEKVLKAEFTQANLDQLQSDLRKAIVDILELAKEFRIDQEHELIHARMADSIYRNLYSREQELESIYSIGCPLTSALACALAKTAGRPVTIVRISFSGDLRNLDVWYQVMEA